VAPTAYGSHCPPLQIRSQDSDPISV